MSAARERLEGWFDAGALLRPDAARPNAVDLTRAVAACAGTDLAAVGLASPGAAALAERIGDAAHLVFVLVDGLGLDALERLAPAGFLRRHLAGELRSVFPSATASAITSLAKGRWPGRHAVPGWWTYLPEHALTAVALPFVDRDSGECLEARGLSTDVYPEPSLFARYGRDLLLLQPAPIHGSAYSRYLAGGAPCAGFDDLAHGIDAVLARVEAAVGPTFTYLYEASVDKAAHDHGPGSPEALAAAAAVEVALERLAAGLRRSDARLVVSADHGLVDVPDERRHLLRDDDELTALLAMRPVGEPRAPQLHALEGRRDRLGAAFAERFGERYALLTTDEADALRLFGPEPLSARARERIGDFVAVAGGADVLLTRRPGADEPEGGERMRGFHGGLLPCEVRVPLVLA